VDTFKDLGGGVLFDPYLLFNSHIHEKVSKYYMMLLLVCCPLCIIDITFYLLNLIF